MATRIPKPLIYTIPLIGAIDLLSITLLTPVYAGKTFALFRIHGPAMGTPLVVEISQEPEERDSAWQSRVAELKRIREELFVAWTKR